VSKQAEMIVAVKAMSIQTESTTLSNKMPPASLSLVDAVVSLQAECPGWVVPIYATGIDQPGVERATLDRLSGSAKSLRQSVVALISFLSN